MRCHTHTRVRLHGGRCDCGMGQRGLSVSAAALLSAATAVLLQSAALPAPTQAAASWPTHPARTGPRFPPKFLGMTFGTAPADDLKEVDEGERGEKDGEEYGKGARKADDGKVDAAGGEEGDADSGNDEEGKNGDEKAEGEDGAADVCHEPKEEEGEALDADSGADASAATAADSSNATAMATPLPSPQGTSVIFMRPSQPLSSPHHRGPVLFGAPSPPPGGSPLPASPLISPPASELNGAAVALTASVLSLLTRLLILSLLYGINPFGSGEHRAYSPSPTQHYAFERINDRYSTDGLALRKALDFAPSPGTLARSRLGVWGNGGALGARAWRARAERLRKVRRRGLRAAAAAAAAAASTAASETTTETASGPYDRTVIILDFCPSHHSSPDASSPYSVPPDPIESLRDQVSFVLQQYRDPLIRPLLGREVEVLLRLESPGGVVHDFGLAADQLARLRGESAEASKGDGEGAEEDRTEGGEGRPGDKSSSVGAPALGEIALTICVDRVAASGGYMIACQASPGRLYAAPFAALGSVGVIREGINVHDTLRKVGVRPLVLRAGKDKVPLDMISEVRDEDVDKVQRDMERVHGAFQRLVTEARPGILGCGDGSRGESEGENGNDGVGEMMGGSALPPSSSGVLTGEVYLGQEALRRGLIDRVVTSDEYIAERLEAGDRVLRLYRLDRSKFGLHLNPLDLLLFGSGPLGRIFGGSGICGQLGGWVARCRKGMMEARANNPSLVAAARVGATVGLVGVLQSLEQSLGRRGTIGGS